MGGNNSINMPADRRISEQRTRKEMIDPQLEKAGWYLRDHAKVKIEIPVDGYNAEPFNGVTDYCLYRDNGDVLAVVEAKKTSVDVRQAEAQLTYYVNEIEKHESFKPFGFLANGLEIYFVDSAWLPGARYFNSSHAPIWKTCPTSARMQNLSVPSRSIPGSSIVPTSRGHPPGGRGFCLR